MRYGGGNFLSGPGSLEGSFNAGRQNFENRGRYNSEMLTANLERMLKQAQEGREQELHPLSMQNKQLTNEGLGLGNQQTVQNMGFKVNEEDRKAQKHEQELDAENSKIYGDLAAELTMLPPGARMQHINKRLGNSAQGRNLYRALELGIRNGQTSLDELPKGFAAIAQARARLQPAHIQAMDTAKIQTDGRAAIAETNAAARIEASQEATRRAAQNEADRYVRQRDHDERMARINKERDAEKQAATDRRLERQYQLKTDLEKAKAKADSGSKVDPKTFEALSVKLELLAREEPHEEKRKQLQADADDAMRRSLAKASAGKQQSDTKLDMSGEKPDFKEQSRTPDVPPRGGATGGWGPIKRIQ